MGIRRYRPIKIYPQYNSMLAPQCSRWSAYTTFKLFFLFSFPGPEVIRVYLRDVSVNVRVNAVFATLIADRYHLRFQKLCPLPSVAIRLSVIRRLFSFGYISRVMFPITGAVCVSVTSLSLYVFLTFFSYPVCRLAAR